MVSKRSKLKPKEPHKTTLDPSTTINIFKTLISALESPQGIKPQLLKTSYYFLIQLSSKQQLSLGKQRDLNELFMNTNGGEVRLSFRDLHTLSTIMFNNLEKRLKQLQSSKDHEVEELNLLIRCCMLTLTFHVPQKHFVESGRFLLLIFRKLSLLQVTQGCHENADFEKVVTCTCMFCGDHVSDFKVADLEIFYPCVPSIKAIIEVIIDELLVPGPLRKYLQIVNSLSPVNERLFTHNTNSDDIGVLVELIYSHFSLSISNEGAILEFLNKITWAHSYNPISLQLSVISAKTLLQNPIFLSFPKLFQAHIVSLVSNIININITTEKLKPDLRFIDSYLSVFETSVTLYSQHMSILKTENRSPDARGSLVISHNESSYPSFESCIDPAKRERLDRMMTTLNESWSSNLKQKFFMNKSDLVTSSIEYMQQSACILDIECQNDVLSFLRSILAKAANDGNNIKFELKLDANLEDTCLLAALLMLMSNSLIQSVLCLRYCGDQKHHKEYDVIIGVINGFKETGIQKFSMETCSKSRKKSKLMIIHFLELLSLSFDIGFDFLVKSCVSVIMALTTLFVLEDGNIDALRSLLSERSLIVYKEPLVCGYSTRGVAAKFQKIRTLYVSKGCGASESRGRERVGGEETCGGEMFLKSRIKGGCEADEIDELADFVECKKGKDYQAWLKGRDKFRKWKLGKRVKRRWEKKKQAWRSSIKTNKT